MKIFSAEYVKSGKVPGDYPAVSLPEVAFVGRSNVGKSSLINALVGRKRLAKTSNTPGLTRTINFFRINNQLSLVDLPGYGFARVPLKVRASWKPMVETYLTSRRELRLVVLILDVRRIPSKDDVAVFNWLSHRQIPTLNILTKIDKISRNQLTNQMEAIKKGLGLAPEATLIPFSAKTGEGKEAIWQELKRHLTIDW